MELDEFNAMAVSDATATVSVWAAIPSWVARVVAARSYDSVGSLVDTAAAFATRWTRADLDAALAHHPRIGERSAVSGAEAEASRREQMSMSTADEESAARMARGNVAYEQRFGRTFLIRAAGRSAAQLHAELERRLTNDDEAEASEALEQLAEIALLRLKLAVSADERIPS